MITPVTSQQARCASCAKLFLILPAEQIFYQKKELPMPENCPDCRQKRRLSLRNENKLYKRICDKCGKSIISTYREDNPYKVYCHDCFWESLI